jgi:hypothetical protein
LKALQASGERVILIDVRKDRAWEESGSRRTVQSGCRRTTPHARRQLALPRHDWLVAYCA